MKGRFIITAALMAASCGHVADDLETYGLNCKVSELSLQADTLERSYTVRFNTRGQVAERLVYGDDGQLRFREISFFNKKGELREIQGINGEKETEDRYEYEWDGPFVRECRMYGMNNDELHRWVHENDGKHIVRTVYFSEGVENYVTTKDFSGNSYTEISCRPDGTEIGRANVEFFVTDSRPSRIKSDIVDIEIEYNDKGLPARSRNTVVNSMGEMQWTSDLEVHPERFYSYEYDERGNWITRTMRVHPDSVSISVLRRSIAY